MFSKLLKILLTILIIIKLMLRTIKWKMRYKFAENQKKKVNFERLFTYNNLNQSVKVPITKSLN